MTPEEKPADEQTGLLDDDAWGDVEDVSNLSYLSADLVVVATR